MGKTNKEKHAKKPRRYIYILVAVLSAVAIGFFWTFQYVKNKIYVPNKTDIITDKFGKEKAEMAEEKGIINVMLIGVDAREGEEKSRTDSIILGTLDGQNRKIKLTSIMRDLYVPIEGYGQSRINESYFDGGPELLLKTVNNVFNANVSYYVSVDFKAFQEVVDKLGGVDLEVKPYEVNEINKFIKEVNGKNADLLKGAGVQHLNGQQTLSYCRIRMVGNSDYERTERQRRVLSLLIEKMRKTNFVKLTEAMNSILPYVKTNIPTSKLMSLAYTAYKYSTSPVESMRIPVDGAFKGMNIYGADVLVPDVEKNVAALEHFIFSSGSGLASDVPAYMANNFHSKDVAIDKRGQKKSTVNIVIPPDAVRTPNIKTETNNKAGKTDKKDNEDNKDETKNEEKDNNEKENTGETATP